MLKSADQICEALKNFWEVGEAGSRDREAIRLRSIGSSSYPVKAVRVAPEPESIEAPEERDLRGGGADRHDGCLLATASSTSGKEIA
jgi:hypothetical protein